MSKIPWTEKSINPITGCNKFSEGCDNCYALAMIPRLQKGFKMEKYANGTKVTCHHGVMEEVLKRKQATLYFVCSMSDLFHREVPLEFIQYLFGIMNQARQHQFILLTKRSKRLVELAPNLNWTPNIRMGVTVESARHLDRIEELKQVPAHVRWLSLEPLLTAMDDLTAEILEGIHWVVVGGESGRKPREMKTDWARYIRDLCTECNIPFFFKQHGSYNGDPHKGGNILDGRTWMEQPEHP